LEDFRSLRAATGAGYTQVLLLLLLLLLLLHYCEIADFTTPQELPSTAAFWRFYGETSAPWIFPYKTL
jgi:hypothetical protein